MSFFEAVYKVVSSIPEGKVLTYKDVAISAGSPDAARAVGTAMKINPDAPIIPCHRVVAFDGKLAGYSGVGGLRTKKRMLEKEGVIFNEDKVDLSVSRWNVLDIHSSVSK